MERGKNREERYWNLDRKAGVLGRYIEVKNWREGELCRGKSSRGFTQGESVGREKSAKLGAVSRGEKSLDLGAPGSSKPKLGVERDRTQWPEDSIMGTLRKDSQGEIES